MWLMSRVIDLCMSFGGTAQPVRVGTCQYSTAPLTVVEVRLSDPLRGLPSDATCLLDNGAHFEAVPKGILIYYFIISSTHFQWRPEYLVFAQSLACTVQYCISMAAHLLAPVVACGRRAGSFPFPSTFFAAPYVSR
jgi:hypothetical protein